MPVPTRSTSPPSMTPSRPNLRTPSSNTSYTPTITMGGSQHKLNVVTRVAIEGKAKKGQGQNGASIKMFLKISVPLDSVSPGSTIPLFPEENLKILTSQVHPLDPNSVPYNFSSTLSPLLHSAARSLNLPARSSQTFESAFREATSNGYGSSIRTSKSENSELVPPVDVQYTGHILVSGYSIAFVLPKEFLPRPEVEEDSYPKTPLHHSRRHKSEDEVHSKTPLSTKAKRRMSTGERNQAHFMAAIDLWVPFISMPPRAPFFLSIPTPRCLHNNIKLRIFPPANNTSTSFASLSSMEDDSSGWDLTCDPHVARNASARPSRTGSYSHFADDESSDASTSGTSESSVIQGTFPSAERIRIRWAKSLRKVNMAGEGDLLRVGVESVTGDMSCTVRGKGTNPSTTEPDGVLINVQYSGQCKGIWFPGVATKVGLDVSLVTKGYNVSWAPGHPAQWEVSGGAGFEGFDIIPSTPHASPSRMPSMESNGSSPDPDLYDTARTRTNSSSSTNSLLRAPLPVQNVAEYSFEGSNATLPSNASSISSLPVSSDTNLSSKPTSTIALRLNLNELQPLAKSSFDFTISGTIIVTPRSTVARAKTLSPPSMVYKTSDPEPVLLPRFTVLAADTETTPITVKNEVEGASVEVFQAYGDIHKDPQLRKTVLQKNGATRCGEDGGRIALKSFDATLSPTGEGRPGSRPRSPSNNIVPRPPRNPLSTRAKRDGPPIITSVEAAITALTPGEGLFPDGYAVRLSLKTPAIIDSEWLEFGLSTNTSSKISSSSAKSTTRVHPHIVLICASIDGVPVKAEMTKAVKSDTAVASSIEQLSGKEWICWGKVYAGASVGGNMVIDYLVREEQTYIGKGKRKMPDFAEMDILLPTFFLSVARFEAKIDAMPGLDMSVRSEFDYVHASPDGHRLLLCSVKEYTQPHLSLSIRRISGSMSGPFIKWSFIFTWAILLAGFASLYRLSGETDRLTKLSQGYSNFVDSWPELPTITTTATVYPGSGSGKHWWFGDSESLPSMSSTPSAQTSFTTTDPFISTTMTDMTSPTKYDRPVKETSMMALPSHSTFETYGLMPLAHIFTFAWNDQHADALRHVMEKVVVSMQFAWDICRKVYHYPLDPP